MRDAPSNEELERLFAANAVPRRHLYPLRYRIARAAGLQPAPPVRYGLAEHFLYEGLTGGVLLIAAAYVLYWIDGTDPRWSWPAALIIALVIPLTNWLRYRDIRRRIGMQP